MSELTKRAEDVLTKDGFRKFMAHLFNIEEGLFYITNHADDLEIYDEELELLYKTSEYIEKIINE